MISFLHVAIIIQFRMQLFEVFDFEIEHYSKYLVYSKNSWKFVLSNGDQSHGLLSWIDNGPKEKLDREGIRWCDFYNPKSIY